MASHLKKRDNYSYQLSKYNSSPLPEVTSINCDHLLSNPSTSEASRTSSNMSSRSSSPASNRCFVGASRTAQILDDLFKNRHNYKYVNKAALDNVQQEIQKIPISNFSTSRPARLAKLHHSHRAQTSRLPHAGRNPKRIKLQHNIAKPYISPAYSDNSCDSGYTDEEQRALTAAYQLSHGFATPRHTTGSCLSSSVQATLSRGNYYPSPESSTSSTAGSRPVSATPPFIFEASSPALSFSSTCYEQTPPQWSSADNSFSSVTSSDVPLDAQKHRLNDFPDHVSNINYQIPYNYMVDASASFMYDNSFTDRLMVDNNTVSSNDNSSDSLACSVSQNANKWQNFLSGTKKRTLGFSTPNKIVVETAVHGSKSVNSISDKLHKIGSDKSATNCKDFNTARAATTKFNETENVPNGFPVLCPTTREPESSIRSRVTSISLESQPPLLISPCLSHLESRRASTSAFYEQTTDTPSPGTPAHDTPITATGISAHDTPITNTPAHNTPITDTPAHVTPITDTPAPAAPTMDTQSPDTPAYETPAPDTAAHETPAPDTPTRGSLVHDPLIPRTQGTDKSTFDALIADTPHAVPKPCGVSSAHSTFSTTQLYGRAFEVFDSIDSLLPVEAENENGNNTSADEPTSEPIDVINTELSVVQYHSTPSQNLEISPRASSPMDSPVAEVQCNKSRSAPTPHDSALSPWELLSIEEPASEQLKESPDHRQR